MPAAGLLVDRPPSSFGSSSASSGSGSKGSAQSAAKHMPELEQSSSVDGDDMKAKNVEADLLADPMLDGGGRPPRARGLIHLSDEMLQSTIGCLYM